MSAENEYKQAEGVYAVPRRDGKSVLIGVHSEDLGKIEGGEDSELLPIQENMFGLIAGKTEGSEFFAATVWRELREETGLVDTPITGITNTLPTVTIFQQRAEGKLKFRVHGHRFDVTQANISRINEQAPTWEVSDDQLIAFLQQEGSSLRPSVYIILHKIVQQHLQLGGKI